MRRIVAFRRVKDQWAGEVVQRLHHTLLARVVFSGIGDPELSFGAEPGGADDPKRLAGNSVRMTSIESRVNVADSKTVRNRRSAESSSN